jgi:tetratricopeptide (TPR) repeat protein
MPQTDSISTALAAAAATALQAGDIPLAISRLEAARRLVPADVAVLRSLGALYRHNQDWGRAWSAAETGLHLAAQTDAAGFRDDRIAAMAGAGFADAACVLAAAEAEAEPGDPQARYRHGDLLLQTGRHDAALDELQAALAVQADRPDILLAAAEAAFRCGDHGRSRTWLDRAVALEPDNRSVRLARATILLSQGIWDPGLADYEYRLQPDAGLQIVRDLNLPRWQGEDLDGETLLVVAEQGVGDQMRMARDLPTLQGLCGRLIVECASRLAPIFARSLPGITVVPSMESRQGPMHRFDYGWLAEHAPVHAYIELGSVMLRLWQRGLAPDRKTF